MPSSCRYYCLRSGPLQDYTIFILIISSISLQLCVPTKQWCALSGTPSLCWLSTSSGACKEELSNLGVVHLTPLFINFLPPSTCQNPVFLPLRHFTHHQRRCTSHITETSGAAKKKNQSKQSSQFPLIIGHTLWQVTATHHRLVSFLLLLVTGEEVEEPEAPCEAAVAAAAASSSLL